MKLLNTICNFKCKMGEEILNLSEIEKYCAEEILKLLAESDVKQLASTVTGRMLLPETRKEAEDFVILHTESLESLLLRRKVSREVLFKYLHRKKIPVVSTADKQTLVDEVLQLCNSIKQKDKSGNSVLREEHSSSAERQDRSTSVARERNEHSISVAQEAQHVLNSEGVIPVNMQSTSEVDELAHQFSIWFYTMFNQHQINQETLGVQHFWQDCNMRLFYNSETDCSQLEVKSDAAGVVELLGNAKIQNNLCFNPNLSREGVRGKTDVHGLVAVLVCGTLHQQERCVGVFEQIFGLVRDPTACNHWKIKFTELYLRSKNAVTGLPTLEEGNLLNNIQSLPSIN